MINKLQDKASDFPFLIIQVFKKLLKNQITISFVFVILIFFPAV